MQVEYFHVDAFADRLFAGNPAGVCLLESWIWAETMQRIASENNLSETAFIVPAKDYFEIRWFTPQVEVDLCGHATLASAYVLFQHKAFHGPLIQFRSNTDNLAVEKAGEILYLDFPPVLLLLPQSIRG